MERDSILQKSLERAEEAQKAKRYKGPRVFLVLQWDVKVEVGCETLHCTLLV